MKSLSIQFRIISIILIILLLSVVGSITFTTINQRNNLLDSAKKTLSVNTSMLNLTIRNIMLSGEAPIANQTMNDIRSIPDFKEFELYKIDGNSAFSSYETLEFVNNYQDKIMFDPTPRTEGNLIDNPGFVDVLETNTPIIRQNNEDMEMEYFFPILNYAECRACHGSDQFIRGISHMRISLSGIFNKVRTTGIILSLFFLATGLIIFFGLFIMLRKIIITPVLTIGRGVNLVAEGNLETSIHLDRDDELGELSSRINNMITGLKERNDLLLENKVIETRLEESKKYLNNINEGLMLLDSNYKITQQYSLYLTRLFEQENLAGIDFRDFLYPNKEKYKEEREALGEFLEMMFTNATADMDMILSINPLNKVSLKVGKKEIIIRADFQRIIENDEIENLMIIFEDLTTITKTQNALDAQKKQRASELEQIAAILKVGPAAFEGFIKEAWEAFWDLRKNISQLSQKESLDRIFREIHSVKGSARYLDYNRIEELTNNIEEILAEMRDKSTTSDKSAKETISRLLEELFLQMEGVEALVNRFKQFSVQPSGADPEESLFSVFKSRVDEMIRQLAKIQNKKINLNIETELKSIRHLQKLQPALLHLIRNAVDHGIEESMDRVSKGKSENALLNLRFKSQGDSLLVEVEDDGKGINWKKIRIRGLEKGLITENENDTKKLSKLLFLPGFSTRRKADSISGRGVGLDAVWHTIKEMGGKIKLWSKENEGTRFTLLIPIENQEKQSRKKDKIEGVEKGERDE